MSDDRLITILSMTDQDIETNKNPNFEITSASVARRMQAGIEKLAVSAGESTAPVVKMTVNGL